MRVTLVNRLAGIQRGGGEIYDISLASALQRGGARVEIVTGRPLLRDPLPPPGAVPTRYVRTPYLRAWSQRMGRAGLRLFDLDLGLFGRAAERLVARSRPAPDLIQVTGLPYLARNLERRGGPPVVLLFPGPPSLRNREAILACATVVGVGAVTPYLREHFPRIIHDMTAGVDSSLFRPGVSSAREGLGLPAGSPVVLYAGRLVPLKNIPLLAEVFAGIRKQVPEARFLVAGDGPLRGELISRAARYGLSCAAAPSPADVVLAGEIPHEAMPGIYAAADLLLLASVNESFSLAALEAMACALPVVAPRVGYLPRLIEDGVTGHLYAPGDVEEGARRAAALLSDAGARRRAGSAARDGALARHSWDAVAADFSRLYRDLLAA